MKESSFGNRQRDSVIIHPDTPEDIKWGAWEDMPPGLEVESRFVMSAGGHLHIPVTMILERDENNRLVGRMPATEDTERQEYVVTHHTSPPQSSLVRESTIFMKR